MWITCDLLYRLLVKLPASYCDGFVEYCLSHGILITGSDKTYTLVELSVEQSQAKRILSIAVEMFQEQVKPQRKGKINPVQPSASMTYNSADKIQSTSPTRSASHVNPKDEPKTYCTFCHTWVHKSLSSAQILLWLKDKGCQRCGCNHEPETL